MPQLWRSNSF